MNVLVVDDSKFIRRVLIDAMTKYFQGPGSSILNLYEAADGNFAMEHMKQKKIDIVLLDWNMPRMNGAEVVDAIRANKEWHKTRIIMITTEGSKESVMKMIKKGVNSYIVKPFNEEAIFKKMDIVTARMVK